MPKTPAAEVQAGERVVRVSSPDRVIYEKTDRTPEIDPYSPDQAELERQRARVLEVADIVIPGHGEPFRVER